MIRHLTTFALLYLLSGTFAARLSAAPPDGVFGPAACEGAYDGHLQGVCTNDKDAIFWSFTVALVKTDRDGKILKRIPVVTHHGDLCYVDGKVYVAVNLGKFNDPQGNADSWVYVYRAEDLSEIARHKTPELFHGAGGIAYHNGRFVVVGGLPESVNENYVYEYDPDFKFIKRHVIASGHTEKGIQTAAYADGFWWFGCYGEPKELLKTDESFHMVGKYVFDCALGIAPLADKSFLIGYHKAIQENGKKVHMGGVAVADADAQKGLIIRNESSQ